MIDKLNKLQEGTKSFLRWGKDESQSTGDKRTWTPAMARASAQAKGPFDAEELIEVWARVNEGQHLSWEWTYRLLITIAHKSRPEPEPEPMEESAPERNRGSRPGSSPRSLPCL